MKTYVAVSGMIFAIITVVQISRALMQLPVHIGSFEVPVWASWLVAAVAGSLCTWAFRSKD